MIEMTRKFKQESIHFPRTLYRSQQIFANFHQHEIHNPGCVVETETKHKFSHWRTRPVNSKWISNVFKLQEKEGKKSSTYGWWKQSTDNCSVSSIWQSPECCTEIMIIIPLLPVGQQQTGECQFTRYQLQRTRQWHLQCLKNNNSCKSVPENRIEQTQAWKQQILSIRRHPQC